MPLITIAVCTHNGAARLPRFLGALSRAGRAAIRDTEVLIVDNASTDDTGDVVDRFRRLLPLTYIREDRPGLSHARNRALDAATSDLVAFTDDDCIACANWAPNYADAGRRYSDAAFFGGDIVPIFLGADVEWAEAAIREVPDAYARIAVGRTDVVIDPQNSHPRLPYGANFCLRRSRIGALRFDPALGRQPGSLMSGEETAFMRKLLERGQSGRLLAGNPVQHWIEPDRQSMRYISDYYRDDGRRRRPVRPFTPAFLRTLERFALRIAYGFADAGENDSENLAQSMRRCREMAQRLGSLESRARPR